MTVKIYGMQKTTLVDYPGRVATTLFTGGCNFRCPYCHNGDLIVGLNDIKPYTKDDIFDHLRKRRNVLDGVVISGGEPTLNRDLPDFIRQIKLLGYKVKLDTNGTNPAMLRSLVKDRFVDYVAMDIKQCRTKYADIVHADEFDLDAIAESVEILKASKKVDYEFRTTVCQELHETKDMTAIGMWLSGAKAYYLQPYKESPDVLHPGFHAPDDKTMQEFVQILSAFLNKVEIRG
ncbi:anaerobic ribonucleoside-triphosphate reductase activating protein [Roseburia sp. AM51-8]|uniref:anaerobic ribonucleoside-triphosphate reductase activating protein n=1 Tax=Roseburia sp. AM51-8 TaxID=2292366 RepID=UPI000E4D9658|nr:anaerobic ribonucleoside-triphosphate reductase activating protein [Roseburia sp. AM51-8]RHQ00934.1 anaerobic ribonucleoside-triphosphate reductase activating protein [Roseburia sp. AM51-8]